MKEPATHNASAPSVVKQYIAQRFNIGMFSMLALYLLLFAKANWIFGIRDVADAVVLLVFLLAMRLYDDLQNIPFDSNKSDRIYTDPTAAKKLYIFFLRCMLLVTGVTLLNNTTTTIILLTFIIVNHGVYAILITRGHWRYYLPLVKYPFIALLVSGTWSLTHLSLFFAFAAFDVMDDRTFPVPRWGGVLFAFAAFALVLYGQSQVLWIAYGLTGVGGALTLIRGRYSAFAFLLVFLIAKLTLPYEV